MLRASSDFESDQQPLDDLAGRSHQQAQKRPEAGQDLPQVVAGTAEEGVDRVSRHSFEEVPPEEPITLHVADLGLDGGPPPKVAPEGIPELAGAADENLTPGWIHPVALVPTPCPRKWSRGHGL